MLRDLGQKNASAELFIMTFPISLGLLHYLIMPYYREAENMFFFEKICLRGGTFFGLKFYINSIPNF